MNQTDQATNGSLVDESSSPIAEYSETIAGLAKLRDKFEGVLFDCAVPKEMEAAKEARAEVREYRYTLEQKRKDLKAPVIERGRLIDSEANRIKSELLEIEDPIDSQIKAEEQRKENEKREIERQEAERKAQVQRDITAIGQRPLEFIGKPAAEIADAIEKAQARLDDIDQHFETEFLPSATLAMQEAIAKLQELHDQAVAADEERERLKAREKELEEERKREAEEREREAAARAKREAKEAEERRQQEAAAAKEREAKEAREAEERAAKEREAQAEREEKQAAHDFTRTMEQFYFDAADSPSAKIQELIDQFEIFAARLDDDEPPVSEDHIEHVAGRRDAIREKLRHAHVNTLAAEERDRELEAARKQQAEERERREQEEKERLKREIETCSLIDAAEEALALLQMEGFEDHGATLKLRAAIGRAKRADDGN